MAVDALVEAADGVYGVMDALREVGDVRDIDSPAAAFGEHARLAAVTAEFCDRWHDGVKNLTRDGEGIAYALDTAAQEYLDSDEAARKAIEQYGR
ncbi:hypothetical protein GCM10027271_42740 [Saccharopolyspora gloriosae]|uniref:Excreted virulence factor EspC (Type VII ESX diderm) n=1 Tax=Saccharopolyspora gloriosae TaxID=455344 RepID=A0A840NET1_9PSEU|nr:hypothetical protein [Saccharopolyspora gloriosae]